jgi:hypothetical protein
LGGYPEIFINKKTYLREPIVPWLLENGHSLLLYALNEQMEDSALPVGGSTAQAQITKANPAEKGKKS